MKRARDATLAVALGTSLLLVPACSDDSPAPAAATVPTPGAPPPAAPAAVASPTAAAEAAPAAAFSYSPVGRRDPFRSYLSQVKERRDAQSSDHRHEDTENFEVHQYRLTGLITGTSRPKAMLDDPNGDAHVVHIGSRMGKNGGRVTNIGPRGLTVQEDTVDASGKAVSVPINVRLLDDVLDNVAPEE